MGYATMWVYPWDILDEGVDRALAFLARDVGLDAISLATSYHTVKALLPHNPRRKVFLSESSALYFRPQLDLYANTPLKPHPSPMVKDEDILKTISSRCRTYGLELISWTVCLHNSYLGRRHPECTMRNAYGDPYPFALCPSNQAVRDYLTALAVDLTSNYDLTTLELESAHFSRFAHNYHHEKAPGIGLGLLERFLLSLCFCHSCSERAQGEGIDTEGLKAMTREHLGKALNINRPCPVGPEGEYQQVSEFVAQTPQLAAYVEMRERTVASLIAELKESIPSTGRRGERGFALIEPSGRRKAQLSVIVSPQPRNWITGVHTRRIASIADFVEVLSYTSSASKVYDDISQIRQVLGSVESLTVGLAAYHPFVTDPNSLKEMVGQGLRAGVRRFSFYNYGLMPRENLSWVKEAVELVHGADKRRI
jgi:hypothetical protein